MCKYIHLGVLVILEIIVPLFSPSLIIPYVAFNILCLGFLLFNYIYKQKIYKKQITIYNEFVGPEAYMTKVWQTHGDVIISNTPQKVGSNETNWYLPLLNIDGAFVLLKRYYSFIPKDARCELILNRQLTQRTTFYRRLLFSTLARFNEVKVSALYKYLCNICPLGIYIASMFLPSSPINNNAKMENIIDFLAERGISIEVKTK